MPSRTLTLQDIADVTGYSRSTVSLALRGHPRIPAETRDKVIQAAGKLGYLPNAEISRLMSLLREARENRERPVMAFLSDYEKPLSSPEINNGTWLGFRQRATELGYSPEEFHITPDLSPDRLSKILHARGIRGVVITALKNPVFAAKMDLTHFALAAIGNVIHDVPLHRVGSDKHYNTLMSCQKLWERGCRRIALLVPGYQEERVEHAFLSGYLVFHHLHKHTAWSDPLVYEEAWQDTSKHVLWIRKRKPDGLIAAYPGLMGNWKVAQGEKIPQICLVNRGTGDQEPGINQRHDLIAAGAVDIVDGQLKRNEFGLPTRPRQLLIRGDWSEDS